MIGTPMSSEEDVVRRLRADDPGSLAQLAAAHRRSLVRYADGILGTAGDGEDVVQEVFFRLWAGRQDVTANGSLRALLYTMTRNAAIDERRRSARRAAVVNALDTPPPSPTPMDAVATCELAGAVAAAVSRLPPGRQRIFLLARVKGLTHQEIAGLLHVSPQTVANQMSAALRSLRQALAWYGGEPSAEPSRRGPVSAGAV